MLGPTAVGSSTPTRLTLRESDQFTNFFEMLAVLVIPASLVFMYGRMTGNRRQATDLHDDDGDVLGAVIVAYIAEAHARPRSTPPGFTRGESG